METNIKKARIYAGKSQKEVAIELGVKAPTVSNWETGKISPTAENLKKLSLLYQVSTDYLLGSKNAETYIGTTDPFEALCLIYGLSASEFSIISGISCEICNTLCNPNHSLSNFHVPAKSTLYSSVTGDQFKKVSSFFEIPIGQVSSNSQAIIPLVRKPSVDEKIRALIPKLNARSRSRVIRFPTPSDDMPIDAIPGAFPVSPTHKIPLLGQIAAGLPIYAEQNIEGYIWTDHNHGGEYFGLRVRGDSMNAAKINDGDIVIVRRQDEVEPGEIAVVLVDDEATVKRFQQHLDTVILSPQSTNPANQPQVYSLQEHTIRILGRVVESRTEH